MLRFIAAVEALAVSYHRALIPLILVQNFGLALLQLLQRDLGLYPTAALSQADCYYAICYTIKLRRYENWYNKSVTAIVALRSEIVGCRL
jgi:hypothetical protein